MDVHVFNFIILYIHVHVCIKLYKIKYIHGLKDFRGGSRKFGNLRGTEPLILEGGGAGGKRYLM